MRELAMELLAFVDDVVDELGSRKALDYVHTICKEGTSADRQLARFEAVKALGGSEQAALVAVVDGIIDDTMIMP